MNKKQKTQKILKYNDKESWDKDCKGYPYLETIIKPVKRIVALGDIHGDFNLLIKILLLVGVIDEDYNWIGGDTVVVQVGDQIDRCRPNNSLKCSDKNATLNDEASDIRILKFMTELHNSALKDNGQVISLFGNHEFMNIQGDMRYVSYKGIREFDYYQDKETGKTFVDGEEARKHAFQPGNEYAKFLGCTRLSAVVIGDFLFAHAGIVPHYANELQLNGRKDINKLNKLVRKWLIGEIELDKVDKIVSSNKNSMFWNRILGNIPDNLSLKDDQCQLYVKPIIDLFDLKGMIIGHTPQFINNSSISKTCDDTILRADFGGSDAFTPFDKEYHKNNKRKSVLRKAMAFEIIDNQYIKTIGV